MEKQYLRHLIAHFLNIIHNHLFQMKINNNGYLNGKKIMHLFILSKIKYKTF